MIAKAEEFAREKHAGQYRKPPMEDVPYIEHPKAIVKKLEDVGVADDAILSAAWLHDVVEDCNVNLDEIKQKFGSDIADLVNILTRKRGQDKAEYAQDFYHADRRAQLIKVVDVWHNFQCAIKSKEEFREWIDYSTRYFLPLAEKVSPQIYAELMDMVGT